MGWRGQAKVISEGWLACAAFFATWHKTADDFVELAEWHNKSLCCFLACTKLHKTTLNVFELAERRNKRLCGFLRSGKWHKTTGNFVETALGVIAATRRARNNK